MTLADIATLLSKRVSAVGSTVTLAVLLPAAKVIVPVAVPLRLSMKVVSPVAVKSVPMIPLLEIAKLTVRGSVVNQSKHLLGLNQFDF